MFPAVYIPFLIVGMSFVFIGVGLAIYVWHLKHRCAKD